MQEDERKISLLKYLGFSKALAKSLIVLSINVEEIEKKKKKKLKSLFDLIYDEEEECEEYYNEAYYDVIAFPPDSSPPSPDKKSLAHECMIRDSPF